MPAFSPDSSHGERGRRTAVGSEGGAIDLLVAPQSLEKVESALPGRSWAGHRRTDFGLGVRLRHSGQASIKKEAVLSAP